MPLRLKTLLIVSATMAGGTMLLYMAARLIVLGGFGELEEQSVRENVGRATEALDQEISRIDSVTGDWALWDDTYEFVADGNQEYIDSNIGDETFVNLGVNFMVYTNQDREVVIAHAVDLSSGKDSPWPAGVLEAVMGSDVLHDHRNTESSARGLLMANGVPVLVASRPISSSDRSAPINGSLIMGRYLDESAIFELERVTHLDLALTPASASAQGTTVVPLDGDHVTGQTVIEDVGGDPAMTLSVTMPRDIYKQGQTTAMYLIGALLAAGALFAVVTVVLLERTVLSPVKALSKRVGEIDQQRDYSLRLAVHGRDEIGRLSAGINVMLSSIQELNLGLEEKVRERTRDLELANRELSERNRQLLDARAQAATDALTDLQNHRAFQQRVRLELPGARASGSPLSLMMVDIDRFKAVNDSLGHLVGDSLLRDVARIVASVAGHDNAYRYGGDEFAVVLPGMDTETAGHAAEQIRREVAGAGGARPSSAVTVSIGVATFPDGAQSAEELIYGADAAMYVAKSSGKNRVSVWDDGVSLPARVPDYLAAGTLATVHEDLARAADALVAALAAKDPGTSAHGSRCSEYALGVARELGLADNEVATVTMAALLHDIGKLGVPDRILNKPGPLDDREWIQMRRHPVEGHAILAGLRGDPAIADAVLHHHEHYDGSGYPDGLAGEDIPIASRILLVTDAFDAMTTDRPYRRAMDSADAIAEIRRKSGSQFDPNVVEAFLRFYRLTVSSPGTTATISRD